MTQLQQINPQLWARYRDDHSVSDKDREKYQAMKKALQEIYKEHRDAHPAHKRIPYKLRHISNFKNAIRTGNLATAAWSLYMLGVSADYLNSIVALISD